MHPLDLSAEDEDRSVEEREGLIPRDEGLRSAAGEKIKMPNPDEVYKGERPGGSGIVINEVDGTRPVAVEMKETFESENEDIVGDSVSVTSVATHQFSSAWIKEEALALQKNALESKNAHRNKVLLAGYGFGGIVVKNVLMSPSNALVDLLSPSFFNILTPSACPAMR